MSTLAVAIGGLRPALIAALNSLTQGGLIPSAISGTIGGQSLAQGCNCLGGCPREWREPDRICPVPAPPPPIPPPIGELAGCGAALAEFPPAIAGRAGCGAAPWEFAGVAATDAQLACAGDVPVPAKFVEFETIGAGPVTGELAVGKFCSNVGAGC